MHLADSKQSGLGMRNAVPVVNRSWVVALLLAVAAASGCGSESSPEDLDRLMVQAEQQAEEGGWAALSTLQKVRGLRRQHRLEVPDEFWLRHARVASEVGRHHQAVDSATRYVMTVGRDGNHYTEALELLEASEAELQREREADQRRQRERREAGVQAVTEYLALHKRLAETGQGDGGVFADPLKSGGHGPAMVTIPAGTFQMGCVSGLDCRDNEKPVRELRIAAPFALSVYEVTFAEWDACAAAAGCDGYRPDDWDNGRASRPVTNVSWDNANSYVEWLSGETGAEYRLPNEAQWEYAARAGTVTKYSWGNEIGVNRANCAPDYCGDPWDSEAPVGSFAPNAWGLYDMHGNVWELVEGGYSDADLAGSARDDASTDEEGASSTVFGWRHRPTWLGGRLVKPVMRGGSSSDGLRSLGAAFRAERSSVHRGTGNVGFRVARTLAP